MGRFLAIVIALVAIALLINSSLNKKDDPVVNDGANDGATVAPTDEQSSTPSSDTPSADIPEWYGSKSAINASMLG